MIQEVKKELIDKKELYQVITTKARIKYNENINLDSSLTLAEILQEIFELPVQNELKAVWILDGVIWRCSWCKMSALESYGKSFPSKHCPYCGRRMKMEGNNGSKT